MTIAAIAASSAQTGPDAGFGRLRALPTSRALVPVDAPAPASKPIAASATRRVTADAALVAHLWATRENAPQTRARRRAAPGTARSAYERADGLRDRPAATRGRTV